MIHRQISKTISYLVVLPWQQCLICVITKKRGIRALSWKRARNCHAAAGRLQAKTSIHFALMVRTWTANKNSCFALGVFVDSHMDSSRSRAQLQQQKKLVTGTSWLISEHNCIIWKELLNARMNDVSCARVKVVLEGLLSVHSQIVCHNRICFHLKGVLSICLAVQLDSQAVCMQR